jgi:molecular chaperone DnaK (HSP70)
MNKTAGFDEWMNKVKLKLYGWMTKSNIQSGDNANLEKMLNDYTNLKADLQKHLHTLQALNEAKSLTLEISKNLNQEGIPTPNPKTSKIDRESEQVQDAIAKIDEVLAFIGGEVQKRGLKVNRMATKIKGVEGPKLYLMKNEISSRG